MVKLFSVSASLNQRAYGHLLFYQRQLYRSVRRGNGSSLSSSILLSGDPNFSAASALEQWVREGKPAYKHELQKIITELSSYRRFKHALEVSLWMTNQRNFPISSFDVSVRLKLIHQVFGLARAEDYFNKIPENSRTYGVYLALLNIYCIANSVEEADSIMHKATELGYVTKPIWYNLLMKLHYKSGNKDKLASLLTEMEEKRVPYDQFSHYVCFITCARDSDIERMDIILRTMESGRDQVYWRTYVVASKCYLKTGLVEKALVMLNKLENKLTTNSKDNILLFIHLIDLYADAGMRDQVYHVWNLYKPKSKVINKVYYHMIHSLIKLKDVKEAEQIFQEWVRDERCFDFRIPNLLIDVYCLNGDLEKAEEVISSGISRGGEPWIATWCCLAYGYLKESNVCKASEALAKAVSICPPRFRSRKDLLTTCLKSLTDEACLEKAMEMLEFVKSNGSSKDVDCNGFSGSSEEGEELYVIRGENPPRPNH